MRQIGPNQNETMFAYLTRLRVAGFVGSAEREALGLEPACGEEVCVFEDQSMPRNEVIRRLHARGCGHIMAEKLAWSCIPLVIYERLGLVTPAAKEACK